MKMYEEAKSQTPRPILKRIDNLFVGPTLASRMVYATCLHQLLRVVSIICDPETGPFPPILNGSVFNADHGIPLVDFSTGE